MYCNTVDCGVRPLENCRFGSTDKRTALFFVSCFEFLNKKKVMHIILENGHGGVIAGVYQTAGKRSPIWKDGTQLFEGEFNRKVVNRLAKLCQAKNISHSILVPELEDISLVERVKRANAIFKKNKNCVLISVHANAGGGTGYEVFTSVGQTKSDAIAEKIIHHFGAEFPELKLRSDRRDGDADKEAHFYILKQSHCPAVLIECAFMDTENPDCRLMLNQPERFANAIMDGIISLQ
jgi:N-acetylmuramoyl-L-alanine amidase